MGTAKDQLQKQGVPADRVFYATGTLLDAVDFRDEQTYHRGRLARAMQYLHGSGTVSGLHVEYKPAIAVGADPQFPRGRDEELFVNPGIAIDRLGRIIEVPAAACIRLVKWFGGQTDETLKLANHGGAFGGVVVDLFIRFAPCERGMAPAFASGPYDAIDAVAASRVRDAYELELVLRTEHAAAPGPDIPPLPQNPWPDVSALNPADRRAALRTAVFQSWREGSDNWNENGPNRLPEQPDTLDPTSLFLARVIIPTTPESAGASRPVRDLSKAVSVDEDQRPLVYPVAALARVLGL